MVMALRWPTSISRMQEYRVVVLPQPVGPQASSRPASRVAIARRQARPAKLAKPALLVKAESRGVKVLLPTDHVVVEEVEPDAATEVHGNVGGLMRAMRQAGP